MSLPKPKTDLVEPLFKAPKARQALAESEKQLADLQTRFAQARYDALFNGATMPTGLEEQVATAERRVAGDRTMVELAGAADAREEARQLAAQAKSQIAAINKFLDRQCEAAVALAKALETVSVAYRDLLDAGHSAMGVVLLPGMRWPVGSETYRGKVDELVSAEVYRLTARANMGGRDALPPALGGKHIMEPQEIAPLAEVLRGQRDHVLAALKGGAK